MNSNEEKITWQIDQEKSKEYWLEVVDAEGWRSAGCKWDGCVHYSRYFDTPMGSEADTIHICNLDEEIARLQSLKKIATQYFNAPGHPERHSEWWPADVVEAEPAIKKIE